MFPALHLLNNMYLYYLIAKCCKTSCCFIIVWNQSLGCSYLHAPFLKLVCFPSAQALFLLFRLDFSSHCVLFLIYINIMNEHIHVQIPTYEHDSLLCLVLCHRYQWSLWQILPGETRGQSRSLVIIFSLMKRIQFLNGPQYVLWMSSFRISKLLLKWMVEKKYKETWWFILMYPFPTWWHKL